VLAAIEGRGASFFNDLTRATKRLASEVEGALWELVAAGLVTADGFENLRSLLDPKRRRGEGRGRTARPRHAAGRWALLREAVGVEQEEEDAASPPEANNDSLEAFARQLLARWGVVFRDIARRETLAPPWRDLLGIFRRMEARGEIRGGRFAQAFIGEQFALPEAVELLRSVRRSEPNGEEVVLAAADPLNLVGVILPGPRLGSSARETVHLRDGVVAEEESVSMVAALAGAQGL
jgi:ATP-dependent Lhr-like helicase